MAFDVDDIFIEELLETADFDQIGMEGLRAMATAATGETVKVKGVSVYVSERVKRRANFGMTFLSIESPTKEAIGDNDIQTLRTTGKTAATPKREASPVNEVSH